MATHEWREDEGEAESAVAKAGSVSDEDITDQVDGIVANPVECISCRVSRRGVEGGQDDNAEDVDTKEEEPGLSASPKIERLRDGELEDATDDGSEDARGADGWNLCLQSKSGLCSYELDRGLEGEHEND